MGAPQLRRRGGGRRLCLRVLAAAALLAQAVHRPGEEENLPGGGGGGGGAASSGFDEAAKDVASVVRVAPTRSTRVDSRASLSLMGSENADSWAPLPSTDAPLAARQPRSSMLPVARIAASAFHEEVAVIRADNGKTYSLCSGTWGALFFNGWCADKPAGRYICERLWWCGVERFLISTVIICFLWAFVFYANAFLVYPLANRLVPFTPSKFSNEDTPLFFAWHMQSELNSAACVYLSFWPVVVLTFAGEETQYASPTPQNEKTMNAYAEQVIPIAQGAHIFMCFIIVDTITALYHKLIEIDGIVHHAMFVAFALSVTYNCFAAYLAGVLLLMEVSTLFLNYFMYFRNRLGYENWSVRLSFGGFVVSFVVFRLIISTYVSLVFSVGLWRGAFETASVPKAQLGFILVCLVLVCIMQLFWAGRIARTLIKHFGPGGSSLNSEDAVATES